MELDLGTERFQFISVAKNIDVRLKSLCEEKPTWCITYS